MQVEVVFFYKPLVKLLAVRTVHQALLVLSVVFTNFNKLILPPLQLVNLFRFPFCCGLILARPFGFDRLLVIVAIVSLPSLHLFLYSVDDLWSDVFQKRLNRTIPYLVGYGNYRVDC